MIKTSDSHVIFNLCLVFTLNILKIICSVDGYYSGFKKVGT